MPNFVLIDHCLDCVGGHYYQYATDILTAAQECGYQPVVALRRQFPEIQRFPPAWRVFRVFRFGFKNEHSAGVDGKSRRPIGLDGRWLDGAQIGWTARMLDVARSADRRKRLLDFESACSTLFSKVGWHVEDIAFLPTMSEFDLLGLVRFFKANPRSGLIDWHVQMHFDIFTGREPDHNSQAATRDLIRRQISDALAQVPTHRLHFYSTTDELCRQYNRLGVAMFRVLPYPARPAQRSTNGPPRTAPRRLRITLAGAVRREKGKRQLGQLVRMLWGDVLKNGQAQLWLQLSPKGVRRLPKEAVAAMQAASDVRLETDAPIVAVNHPLPTNDYDELIRRSDVGLFIYDSERYHSRCSGILVEMLSAGVPVIVPAGCWLAAQIAEVTYDHLDTLQQQATAIRRTEIPARQWRFGMADSLRGSLPGAITCGSREDPAITQVPVPSGAVQALLSFCWACENPPGAYLRVETSSPKDTPGERPAARVAIVGSRLASGPVQVLATLEPNQTSLRLRLQNAYHQMPIHVSDVQVSFLAAPEDQGVYPIGRVGAIVADTSQVPGAVWEMIKHRQHYRHSAWEFSRQWGVVHAPKQTVEILRANR